jgi:large subunit ribosomal protein L1
MMEKKKIEAAVHSALEAKGTRKFTQSVDVAINFKGVDFKKAENRLNIDVVLPVPSKAKKVAVFADGEIASEARKTADLVIPSSELPSYVSDKKKQKELLGYSLLASPQLMPVVGKQLGQVLAARGKLPRPIMPNVNIANLIDATRRTLGIKSKGKYLPSAHCAAGNEAMKEEDLVANVTAILEAVEKKVSDVNISSVYIKTTMGKPIRVL